MTSQDELPKLVQEYDAICVLEEQATQEKDKKDFAFGKELFLSFIARLIGNPTRH